MAQFSFPVAVRAFAAALTVLLAGSASADIIRIGGTGVAIGSIRLLAETFEARNPGTVIEVLPSLGSGGGIKAVSAQAIDLGLSSRPLKDGEVAAGAIAQGYAKTALAFVTSMDNAVVGITTEQLVAIYSGATTHWPNGEPIRLVMRPASESATQALHDMSGEMARAVTAAMERPGLVSATTDQENAETLERLSGAFGLVAMGQIRTEKRRLKVLALNGRMPSAQFPAGPERPFLKTLYLVSTTAVTPQASAFRDFVLSVEASEILAAYDFAAAE